MVENRGYHAHVYYEPGSRPVAERLRETIAATFAVEVGDLHDEPRGPYGNPVPMRLDTLRRTYNP